MTTNRYVSRYLTHFIGRSLLTDEDRYALLLRILERRWITHPPHQETDHPNASALMLNPDGLFTDNSLYNPNCVCFCDIPTESLAIHMSKYSRFGVSFAKSSLVALGANPVFYVARDSQISFFDQHRWQELIDSSLAASLQEKIEEASHSGYQNLTRRDYFEIAHTNYERHVKDFQAAINQLARGQQVIDMLHTEGNLHVFMEFHLFSYMKFFDSTLADDDPDNFYMEREWRMLRNFHFKRADVTQVILPASYAERLAIDAAWIKNKIVKAPRN